MPDELNPRTWLDAAERAILDYIDPSTLLGALIYLVLFLIAGQIASTIMKRSLRAAMARANHHRVDPLAVGFIENLANVAIWVITLVLYAHLIPSLRALATALLAGASVVSIVVGLAAQNTLGNLVAGLSLLLYRPFRVGDKLQVAAPTGVETGVVESLTLGYTVLRGDRNRRVVLPNSNIANQVTINLSALEQKVTLRVPVTLGLDVDIEKARAELLKIAAGNRDAVEPFSCPMTALAPSGITLTLQVQCADDGQVEGLRSALLEAAAQRLPRAGIRLPYPVTETLVGQIRQSEPGSGSSAPTADRPAAPAS